MKRFALALGLILAMITIAHATAPAYSAVDGVYEWAIDTTISNTTHFDSLVGAADSVQVFALRPFDVGWEYILVRDAITGDGSDSVKVEINLRCFDASSSLLYSVAVDSFTAAAGEAVLLPIGGSAFGRKFTLKFMAYTDNGGDVDFNRISIWKRRPIHIEKPYR